MARDPDGREGEDRVQWKKERRSAEDKVAWAPRMWVEKKSTAGGGMLRSPADSTFRTSALEVEPDERPLFFGFRGSPLRFWPILR